jgi:hypothetical protein
MDRLLCYLTFYFLKADWEMLVIEIVIEKLRQELNFLVLNGMPLNSPLVIKKSQNLDKYVTAYYRIKGKKHFKSGAL